jgi:hypothetical protein
MKTCFNIDSYLDREISILKPTPKEGEIYLSKKPGDISVLGPLLRVNQKLFVIFMLRDPRDTITSKHSKDPEKYWAGLRYWKHNIKYYRKLKYHPRLITIKYEDLVKNSDKIQQQIQGKIPFLEKTNDFSLYHIKANTSKYYSDAMQGLRPISDSSIGNWKNHLPRVAGQLKIHGDITTDLIDFGYEPDSSWLEILRNVEPDLSASHFPEFFVWKDIRKRHRGKYTTAIKYLLRFS